MILSRLISQNLVENSKHILAKLIPNAYFTCSNGYKDLPQPPKETSKILTFIIFSFATVFTEIVQTVPIIMAKQHEQQPTSFLFNLYLKFFLNVQWRTLAYFEPIKTICQYLYIFGISGVLTIIMNAYGMIF